MSPWPNGELFCSFGIGVRVTWASQIIHGHNQLAHAPAWNRQLWSATWGSIVLSGEAVITSSWVSFLPRDYTGYKQLTGVWPSRSQHRPPCGIVVFLTQAMLLWITPEQTPFLWLLQKVQTLTFCFSHIKIPGYGAAAFCFSSNPKARHGMCYRAPCTVTVVMRHSLSWWVVMGKYKDALGMYSSLTPRIVL